MSINPVTVVAGSLLHTGVQALIRPISKEADRRLNVTYPYEPPSIDAGIDAYLKGTITELACWRIGGLHGAALPVGRMTEWLGLNDAQIQERGRMWQGVIEAQATAPSLADAMELWVRQELTEPELAALLARNKVHSDVYAAYFKSLSIRLPEPDDIIRAYAHGLVDDRAAELALRRRGVKLDDWLPYIQAHSSTVGASEAIEYGKRLGGDRDQLDALLLRSGVSDAGQRDMMLSLYQKLPTRADVNLWLQRNVFDQAYVTDFRLDEGFDERFWARFSTVLEAGGWTREYSYLDYAAHWVVPATGQLAEMVQRLRPGRVDPSLVYTAGDYERTLAEQDYAPYYRQRLLAISYRPLPIRFLRAAYQTDTLTKQGVAEAYQDQGYSAETARFMADTEEVIKARARAGQSRGWTPQALAKAYINGQVDAGTVGLNMQALGFTTLETQRMLERATAEYQGALAQRGAAYARSSSVRGVLAGFRAGTVSAGRAEATLVTLGWDADSAAAALQSTELVERAQLASRAVAALRRAFLRGEIGLADAQNTLTAAGLDVTRVSQLTSLWPLELSPARKHISAGQIRKGVLSGLLSTDQARAALERLGYPEPDALLLTGEFGYDLLQQQIKLDQAATKGAVGAASQMDRLLALNVKLDAKIRAALKHATPVAKLVSWFASGYIKEDFFRHRLSQMGYDSESIGHYLADAVARRAKLESKAASAAPPRQGPSSNGAAGGGGTGGAGI
jgi:hypothetical protein